MSGLKKNDAPVCGSNLQMGSLLTRKVTLGQVLALAACVLTVATLSGFGSRWHWFLDLFSHFRVQYCLGFLTLAVGFLLLKATREGLLCFVGAGLNALVILPLFFGKNEAGETTVQPWRVVTLNLETANQSHVEVRKFIGGSRADFVVLLELDEVWLEALQGVLASYPHSQVEAREDNFGIGIWSKLPLTRSATHYISSAEVPTLTASLDLGGTELSIIATHPVPPGGGEMSRLRNEQLAALPALLRQTAGAKLLLGDLNVTPWSWHFQRLLEETALEDSARGYGVQVTWPTGLPFFYIPLDHCLHSKEVFILYRQTGPRVGSDHLPLIVDFGVL